MTRSAKPSLVHARIAFFLFTLIIAQTAYGYGSSVVGNHISSGEGFPVPSSMTANFGTTPQSAMINTNFLVGLGVTILDGSNSPEPGISVTFTAPASGVSGLFNVNGLTTLTVMTDAAGVAVAVFSANSMVGGPYNVVASSNGLPNVNFSLTNAGGPPTHFVLTAPSATIAGSPFNFTVTALDASNNLSSLYAGTVHFTSSDNSPALIPGNSTLTNGQGTFTAIQFKTGVRTISAYDTANSSIGGMTNNISVSATDAYRLSVTAPVTAFRGIGFSFTVTAFDRYDNEAPNYSGMLHFNGTDVSATMPPDSFMAGPSKAFSTTLFTVGSQTVSVSDANASLAATSNSINVFNINTGIKSRADFDGDGKTDVSVFRPADGNWYVDRSTSGFSATHFGSDNDTLVPGDYDYDGKADYAVFRPSSVNGVPDFYVLNSLDSTFSGYSWGMPGDIPMAGDYDGDGATDIAIYRPSTSTWWIWNRRTQAVSSFTFGASGDVPMVMDFNGDGKTDLAFYRPSDHTWNMSDASGNPSQNFMSFQWGLPTDILVPADYDGDNKDDVAVYRPSDGTWYIVRSIDGGFVFTRFGISTDIPVPGDYDGDGKDDIAVFRNGTWYLNRSTSGFTSQSFGMNADKPVPAAYHP